METRPGPGHGDAIRDAVQVVIPCRNEAAALPRVLARMPPAFRPIVVDNGSTDATAQVAREFGALVVQAEVAGYGSAVHAGLLACRPGLVAVMDGDATLDPYDLVPLVDLVAAGRADLAVGRRRRREPGAWPWHARLANGFVSALIRRRGVAVHDIAPMRVADRAALLGLGVADRRFGYPLELLLRAGAAGWHVVELDVGYYRRAAGTRSKVTGSVRGSARAARDFARVIRTVQPADRNVVPTAAAPARPVP